MSLSCSDSITTIECAYVENADYFETDSLAKAKLFRNAVMVLLMKRAQRSQQETTSLQFDLGVLERRLNEVDEWIRNHPDFDGADAGVTYADLTGYRN